MPFSFLSKPVTDPSQNQRAVALALIYAGMIATSFYVAYEVRFDFFVPTEYQAGRLHVLPFVIGLKLIALIAARQLGTLMTYFSIPDFFRLMWAMAVASLLLFVARTANLMHIPRGVLLIDFMICSGGLCAGRLATRLFRERLAGHRRTNGSVVQVQRLAIVGAGDAGASLAKEFLTNPSRGFKPVVFFDDDDSKHGKLVHGVLVIGRPEAIEDAKHVDSLAKAVIAMPSAPAKRIREVVALFTERGIKVETLPSLEELASGKVRASRVRPVEVQDLLGRDAVDLDAKGIRNSVQNCVVMVTGAGGSIGGELCRQIAALAPKRLLLVEQSEGALFLIEQELNEIGLGTLAVPLVGDILDEERMRFIFSHYQPEVVFHAAAHKHVYLMERQPAEAIRNNVLGTRLLATIAAEHQVDTFVLISTDKAINPTNVMGATKRLAEIQLLAIAATQSANREMLKRGKAETPKSDIRTSVLQEGAETIESEGASLSYPLSVNRSSDDSLSGKEGALPIGPEAEAATHAATAAILRAVNKTGTAGAGGSPLSVTGDSLSEKSAPQKASNEYPTTGNVGRSARRRAPTKFMAVRFGNVLGSSGSVIPIFKRQIANGGPVTVTHPDVTRYFMTIPEAVGLVMQASILGQGGEIFVLDMGQPVKIVDLAKQMIELSGFTVGDDIEIKFTGLKPGEKLYEELQHKTEQYAATQHPRIMRFTTNAMFSESGVQELQQRLYALDSNALKALLKRLVPEYTPFLD
jgi:FlaA1/EpsC-like NDP-sugar epimerase